MNKLSDELRGANLVDNEALAQRVSGFVATLVIRNQQSKALEHELERRKTTIAEVLLLHQELIEAIREQIQPDLEFIHENQYNERVRDPFLAENVLTTSSERQEWVDNRHQLLDAPVLSTKLELASSSVVLMLEAWKKLLRNELTPLDFQKLFESLQGILVNASLTQDTIAA